MKIVNHTLIMGLVLTAMVPYNVSAETKEVTIDFPVNSSQNQKKSIAIPNDFDSIRSMTVNTGKVKYTIEDNKINIEVDDGKYVDREEFFNPNMGYKNADTVVYSTTNSFPDTALYDDDNGFTGDLSKVGNSVLVSGSLLPGDSKTATRVESALDPSKFPASIPYIEGAFEGTLYKKGSPIATPENNFGTDQVTEVYTSRSQSFPEIYKYSQNNMYGDLYKIGPSYLYSGGIEPAVSKSAMSTVTGTFYCSWSWNGKSWRSDGGSSDSLPSSVYYSEGGYYGTLTQSSRSHSPTCSQPGYSGSSVGDHASPTVTAYGTYVGTVTKPEYDSRVYAQNYTGDITLAGVKKLKITKTASRTSSNTASFPGSIPYSDGNGYSGSLFKNGPAYVISGSYTGGDSQYATTTGTGYYVCSYISDGSNWVRGGIESWNLLKEVSYSSGGYSGYLTRTYEEADACDSRYTLPKNPGPSGNRITRTVFARGVYEGYIYANGYDTRVYQQDYIGVPYKLEDDFSYTYEQNYEGRVSSKETDTRIYRQNYEGTAYLGGTDYRNQTYAYSVKLKYDTLDESEKGCSYKNVTPASTVITNFKQKCVKANHSKDPYLFDYDFTVTGISNSSK